MQGIVVGFLGLYTFYIVEAMLDGNGSISTPDQGKLPVAVETKSSESDVLPASAVNASVVTVTNTSAATVLDVSHAAAGNASNATGPSPAVSAGNLLTGVVQQIINATASNATTLNKPEVTAVIALLGQIASASLVGTPAPAPAPVNSSVAMNSTSLLLSAWTTTAAPQCDIGAVCNMYKPCPAPCTCSNVMNPKTAGRCYKGISSPVSALGFGALTG
ncbi:uncharacterized protein LOC129582230 [Paramacrobiotus metropolitanus]|uniref:uncharacterized protein LOC129582230 n=1 Tax=Paramacrobiotus metropolitanus TaxID=2943436 RepID=UPI0024457CFE|nr:uncharacterized protein LOC129582230 [Paramacrobiotus metropolitanus]